MVEVFDQGSRFSFLCFNQLILRGVGAVRIRQATIAKEKKPATKEKDPKAKAKGTHDLSMASNKKPSVLPIL